MCYHAQYIFLQCGHAISSRLPHHPAPPCPYLKPSAPEEEEGEANSAAAEAAQDNHRPFSFDPSVVASPHSSLPDPFPSQTPWRLERPFSIPESPHPVASEHLQQKIELEGSGDSDVGLGKDRSSISHAPQAEISPPRLTLQQVHRHHQRAIQHVSTVDVLQQQGRCGKISTHPYLTYKIESLCLICRRKRDTRLASFEVHAIQREVDREEDGKNRGLKEWKPLTGRIGRERLPLMLRTGLSSNARSYQRQAGDSKRGEGGVMVKRQRREIQHRPPEQRQQTPWRVTMLPAEVPKAGRGLPGMREGEWI